MTERRLGIIRVPMRFWNDFHNLEDEKVLDMDFEELFTLLKLPSSLEVIRAVWDFDTSDLKIKVSGKMLPIYISGEELPSVDLIFENGVPIRISIYKRTVIHEEAYEKAL